MNYILCLQLTKKYIIKLIKTPIEIQLEFFIYYQLTIIFQILVYIITIQNLILDEK
jgi:hypothetical protein